MLGSSRGLPESRTSSSARPNCPAPPRVPHERRQNPSQLERKECPLHARAPEHPTPSSRSGCEAGGRGGVPSARRRVKPVRHELERSLLVRSHRGELGAGFGTVGPTVGLTRPTRMSRTLTSRRSAKITRATSGRIAAGFFCAAPDSVRYRQWCRPRAGHISRCMARHTRSSPATIQGSPFLETRHCLTSRGLGSKCRLHEMPPHENCQSKGSR